MPLNSTGTILNKAKKLANKANGIPQNVYDQKRRLNEYFCSIGFGFRLSKLIIFVDQITPSPLNPIAAENPQPAQALRAGRGEDLERKAGTNADSSTGLAFQKPFRLQADQFYYFWRIKTDSMKNTALTDKHIELGAKMVPFAGYNMPVQYVGINAEHDTVRKAVGVFDVSHMGEFILKGDGALDLIQRVTSNDASKLYDGKVQYSCLPNEDGGIVDDLLVYRIDDKTYMLVVNASNIEKDWNWISKYNTAGVDMKDISDRTSLLAVQGPRAAEALQSLTDIDLASMEYYTFTKGKFAGLDNVLVSATGYTGAGGFEIYVDNEHALELWNAVFKAGEAFGIKPIGLGARDTLRLEMGFCLYGNDIDDTTSPLEAGLGWVTKFSKPFTNSEALAAQKAEGVKQKLVGFEMIDRGIPRHDYEIVDAEGNVIGKVTSGTQSPSLQKAVGLGYVQTAFAKEGTEIFIKIRDNKVKAKIVKPPFK